MGRARTWIANRILRFLELMNMVPNIRFNSLVSHDFQKNTSLVMSHYVLNYVISEKSKKVLYSRKKAKYTKLVFSGWYSKKNDKS